MYKIYRHWLMFLYYIISCFDSFIGVLTLGLYSTDFSFRMMIYIAKLDYKHFISN